MTSTRFIPFLLLPLLACETSPEGARQNKITSEKEAFVYQVPAARTYQLVRELLAEQGHQLPAVPARMMDADIASEWSKDGHRFIVRFITVDEDHYMVHIIGLGRHDDGTIYSRLRWTEYEWELIQRAEPARALDIARAAGQYADDIHKRNARRR